MEKLFIFKFGGSCLKDKNALEQSLKILEHYKSLGKIVVVTSAFYGITDKLLKWIEITSESNTDEESKIFIKEIEEFHKNTIKDMIHDENLKNESLAYINDRFLELKAIIPELLNNEVSIKNRDKIVSYGERLSTYVYSQYIEDQGYSSQYFSADDGIIITNNIFGNALPILEIIDETIPKFLEPALKENKIPVFTGYYGTTEDGITTTLGRGGTDFTSTILAYALAHYYDVTVIFWKDVYGLLSANPKFEPHAKLVSQISFKEAKELAFFGSKILHPLCLITAEKRGVKVELRNYDDPFSEKSTKISKELIEEKSVIKAITTLERIAMVTIEGEAMVSLPGAAAKLFSIIGENNINVNFISQSSSENNITFGVSDTDGFKAGQVLAQSKHFGNRWIKVRVEHDVSLIAVVGAGMAQKWGIAGMVFTALGEAKINVRAIAQGSSELNISLVINRDDLELAIRTLYHKFIIENGN